MEELHQAATAYYNNISQEFKDMALEFFKSMDTDRDGRVSYAEFTQFLHWNGYQWVLNNNHWFLPLDANRDGYLDFAEFITFYYVLKTRGVFCRSCHAQLYGLYFTCVECFDDRQSPAFDLCSGCYSTHHHHHHHGLFLDSFLLLRSKKGISPGEDVGQAITQPRKNNSSLVNSGIRALEVALSVGNIVGNLAACSIM